MRELRENRKDLSFLSSKTKTAGAMRSLEGLCDTTHNLFLFYLIIIPLHPLGVCGIYEVFIEKDTETGCLI